MLLDVPAARLNSFSSLSSRTFLYADPELAILVIARTQTPFVSDWRACIQFVFNHIKACFTKAGVLLQPFRLAIVLWAALTKAMAAELTARVSASTSGAAKPLNGRTLRCANGFRQCSSRAACRKCQHHLILHTKDDTACRNRLSTRPLLLMKMCFRLWLPSRKATCPWNTSVAIGNNRVKRLWPYDVHVAKEGFEPA